MHKNPKYTLVIEHGIELELNNETYTQMGKVRQVVSDSLSYPFS